MSAVEELGLAFGSMLARALASSAARGRAGLTAASEIWGGHAPRDRPGWYVWLTARPGVFRLDAEDAVRLEAAGGTLLGRLSLRYYPSPLDPDHSTFSPEERAIASGGWLDASGAPRIHAASEIPAPFFTVGTIDCVFDGDGALLAVAMASLDRSRAAFTVAWSGDSYPLGVVSRAAGERVRDVPAWRITRTAFSALAALGAMLGARSAHRLVVSRQRGFELLYRSGIPEHHDSGEVVHGEAALVLRADEPEEVSDAILAAITEPEGEIVLDLHCSGMGAAAACPEPRLEVPIDAAWFCDGAAPMDLVACSC